MSVVATLTESIQQSFSRQLQHEEKQRVKNVSLCLDYNFLKKTMTKERKVKKTTGMLQSVYLQHKGSIYGLMLTSYQQQIQWNMLLSDHL